FHLARPDAPGGAEFGDLFEKVVVAVEEEGQPRGEFIDIQAAVLALTDILETIGQGERQFLRRRRARLADVVPANAYGVPSWHFPAAELDRVHDEPHGRLGRIDEL